MNDEGTRENVQFLPGFNIPQKMQATTAISEVIQHGQIILMVVPTPFVEATLSTVK